MRGLMQDRALSVIEFLDRAENLYFDKEVVTRTHRGIERCSYGDWAARTRRLAGALDALGLSEDARVATFAWNSARHLELYFAPACTGRVSHNLNIRVFPEQLSYIVNHAEDEVIFADRSLLPLLEPVLPTFEREPQLVVMDDGAGPDSPPGAIDYEDLIADQRPSSRDVDDENRAVAMCYTSGTTGNPKGVVYSHRSVWLHTLAVTSACNLGVCETDVILAIVPMFHALAWGLAHAAVASGATIVMPGHDYSAAALASSMESERVTLATGVPTIWMDVLPELAGRDLSALRAVVCGGSAVPRALSEAYRNEIGLPIQQAWGMTETSPLGSACVMKSTLDLDEEAAADLRTSIGPPVIGVNARVIDPESQRPVSKDGTTQGELQVAGPWVASGYYNDPRSSESFTDDGWLRTGDVATVDRHGYLRLVDRTKDVVKSGGEWISSVDLENEIMAHPQVAEAAVIGLPHPKWGERPLACVVAADDSLTGDDISDFLEGRVARWWLPDDIVFVDEIPKTSVGKFSKKDLRERFQEHHFSTA